MHNLLTVKETAKYLRIPLPTVYYLVQRGQLPAIQIGGRWRIKKNALDKDILKEEKSGQPTVLVVDDDESLQNLFKLFLKKIGFSRVVVGTAKEAISYLVVLYETLGPRWMTPDRFRFGASSLLNDVLLQIRKERTGRYQGGDYFTID